MYARAFRHVVQDGLCRNNAFVPLRFAAARRRVLVPVRGLLIVFFLTM
jgi:hypothetical protein